MSRSPGFLPLRRALIVAAGYVFIAGALWFAPTGSEPPREQVAQLSAGSEVWRAAGCGTCHSIYGLGGHTGPDLTNIMRWRGAAYVQAVLLSGRPGMPAFPELAGGDVTNLFAYLAFMDRSGEYPQRTRPLDLFGRTP